MKLVLPLQVADKLILQQFVSFYRRLDDEKRKVFEERMRQFLSQVKITGVKTQVDRLDELFIAASAVIPVFGFEKWEYINLHEVLLYPGSFDQQFNQEGEERTRAGLIGDGPYQHMMVLSQFELRMGFLDPYNKHNTGIHEFVHLVDKTDGWVDGVPHTLMQQDDIQPWIEEVQQQIANIHAQVSDIDGYGATNRSEFLAVAAEYFFNQPDVMRQLHPTLYTKLSRIFQYNPPPIEKAPIEIDAL